MKNLPGITFLLLVLTGAGMAQIRDIEDKLSCPCGCAMVVSTCQGAMECSAASRIDARVQSLVKQGMANDQVIASLVNEYGENILAAPTKKGFNLAAWILPFFLIISLAVLLYVKLKRWSGDKPGDSNAAMPESPQGSEYEKLLDRQLEEFETWSKK
ncbi:hypothetical protein A2V82_13205 [candidate division KSB1 bacterium RBG_16_48_16]|nr:MAG: hypothetical protein A2V82_13205 [candidate division KSB1 bacterium RBG_16_48_16]